MAVIICLHKLYFHAPLESKDLTNSQSDFVLLSSDSGKQPISRVRSATTRHRPAAPKGGKAGGGQQLSLVTAPGKQTAPRPHQQQEPGQRGQARKHRCFNSFNLGSEHSPKTRGMTVTHMTRVFSMPHTCITVVLMLLNCRSSSVIYSAGRQKYPGRAQD